MSYVAQVLLDTPSGYWPLNEASGSTAVDRSGNGRNGTYAGGTVAGSSFLDGRPCPTFAGGSNDYIDLGDQAVWSSHAGANGLWSFDGWFWLNAVAQRFILGKSNVGNTANELFITVLAAGTINPQVTATNGTPVLAFTSTATVTTGTWQYYAFTYDRAAQLLIGYLDGVEISRATTASGTSSDTSTSAFLGGRSDSSTGDRWNGKIAHAAMYATALPAQRVKAHYEAGIRSGVSSGHGGYG